MSLLSIPCPQHDELRAEIETLGNLRLLWPSLTPTEARAKRWDLAPTIRGRVKFALLARRITQEEAKSLRQRLNTILNR